ncbi:MAG: hypothetical protein JKY56_08190 [Kofleriaceae bacterium]|nr:hypothetical protein [Kofleriaceae bacterium]
MGLRNGVLGLAVVLLACCNGDAVLPLVSVGESPVVQCQGASLWSADEAKLSSKAESEKQLAARRTADELAIQERESADASQDAWLERRSQAVLAVEALRHRGCRLPVLKDQRAARARADRSNYPECVGSSDPLCGL